MSKVKLGAKTILHPMPAFLIGADVDDRPNFMVAAWAGIACSEPPMVSVAVRPERHTYKGIKKNRSFSLNVPPVSLLKETDYVGIFSGSKVPDKNETAGFTVFYGETKGAPMIEECHLNIECSTVVTFELGSHDLIIGQINEVHASESAMGEDGKLDVTKVDPLIFTVPGRTYNRLGEVVGQAFKDGMALKPE